MRPSRQSSATLPGKPGWRRIVLIVEDSEACASLLQIVLGSLPGMQVVSYRRAEHALDRIQRDAEAACCALITDLNLPWMDGFELMRLVREIRPAGSFPILVTSGETDPRAPARATHLGADAYFAKPYSPAEVRQTLERLLDENDKSSD